MSAEQRPREFHETEQRAEAYLRVATSIPSAAPLTGYRPRFRLWHYPAFAGHRSWSVFEFPEPTGPSGVIVRQVTWDRRYDCRRLRDPLFGLQEGFHSQPRIEVRDRSLDASALAARIAEAQFVSVPMVAQHTGLCVDGPIFGYDEPEGSRRLEWCCDGPAEWRQFIAWAQDMMEWLHEICAT